MQLHEDTIIKNLKIRSEARDKFRFLIREVVKKKC